MVQRVLHNKWTPASHLHFVHEEEGLMVHCWEASASWCTGRARRVVPSDALPWWASEKKGATGLHQGQGTAPRHQLLSVLCQRSANSRLLSINDGPDEAGALVQAAILVHHNCSAHQQQHVQRELLTQPIPSQLGCSIEDKAATHRNRTASSAPSHAAPFVPARASCPAR